MVGLSTMQGAKNAHLDYQNARIKKLILQNLLIQILSTSNSVFPFYQGSPQFLIKGVSSLKPLILRIYKV